MKNKVLFALLTSLALFIATGCKTSEVLDHVGGFSVGGFTVSESQMESLTKTVRAMEKAFTDITPEQEYYIGRAVAAQILSSYKPYKDKRALRYLNLVGQSLATYSDMPETFGGYHFLILDDDSINAFAAPGGFIFVTRGMLRCCKNEDAVAAVLAHEIAHVQNKHGLQTIKKGRVTQAFTVMATEGARQLAAPEMAQLTDIFEKTIQDITTTLVTNGYSHAFEKQADMGALSILRRMGYDQHALLMMLDEMKQRLKPGGFDFAKTHPDPEERIGELASHIDSSVAASGMDRREKRFRAMLGSI